MRHSDAMPAKRANSLLLVPLLACCALNATAQKPESQAREAVTPELLEEVRVVAPRMDLGISTIIDADISLGTDAIRAFAVNDLGELLDELAPDLDSGRGGPNRSPVILVNGRRIANFSEIRRYPPEAIARVDIYPEEVALQYGFRPDQKVVNFVLQARFRALTTRFASTGWGESADGHGGEAAELDAGYLRVEEATRMNVDLDSERQSPLHESDRDVPANLSAPVSTDARPLRTLLADRQEEALSGGYAKLFGERISATFSGAYRQSQNTTERGLAALSYRVPASHPLSPFSTDMDVQRLLPVPLTRALDTTRYEANATFAANWRGLDLSWISSWAKENRDAATTQGVDADEFLAQVDALSSSVDPFGPVEGAQPLVQYDRTESSAWSSEFLARGVLTDLASGPLQASARILWQSNARLAEVSTDLDVTANRIDRDVVEARFNLDAPLFQGARIGRLSVNFNSEFSDYSDFGSLSGIGAGFTWNPSDRVRLTSSLTQEELAPAMELLGDPIVRVSNRRVFDFVNGETVDAVEVSGGNADLQAKMRDVLSVSARINLLKSPRLALTLNYVDEVTDQPILRFPNQSAEIEDAFPSRYERDALGVLTVFDTRAINLDEAHRREFRWALRYSQELTPPAPSDPRQIRSNQTAKAQKSSNEQGSATRNPRSRTRGPRIRLALDHVISLKDELTLAPGVEPIDYVGVASAGRRRGGAENYVTLRGTYSYRNVTARLDANWQDATETLASDAGSLKFDPLFRANLNLAYSFKPQSPWVQRLPALDGSRVKLSVNNIFDNKPQVSDASGVTPLGYTEDELAPRGRHFALEFRKVVR